MTIMRGKYFKIIALLFCVLCMMISSSCLSKKEAKNGIPNTQPTSLPTTEITTIPDGGNNFTVEDVENAFVKSVTFNSDTYPLDYIEENNWIPDCIEKCLLPVQREMLEDAKRRGFGPSSLKDKNPPSLKDKDDVEVLEYLHEYLGEDTYLWEDMLPFLVSFLSFYAPVEYNSFFTGESEYDEDDLSNFFFSSYPIKQEREALSESDPELLSDFIGYYDDYIPGSIKEVYNSYFTLHFCLDENNSNDWSKNSIFICIAETDIGAYLLYVDI